MGDARARRVGERSGSGRAGRAPPCTPSASASPVCACARRGGSRPARVPPSLTWLGAQVDSELRAEIGEECSKYGEVVDVVVSEPGKTEGGDKTEGGLPLAEEERVRIFVKFAKQAAAMKARTTFPHRHAAPATAPSRTRTRTRHRRVTTRAGPPPPPRPACVTRRPRLHRRTSSSTAASSAGGTSGSASSKRPTSTRERSRPPQRSRTSATPAGRTRQKTRQDTSRSWRTCLGRVLFLVLGRTLRDRQCSVSVASSLPKCSSSLFCIAF